MSFIIVILGLLTGFLVGLTGVGGASLLTPILIIMGINPSIAIGTDLAYNSITKLFGTVQHWRQKTIDVRLVQYLAVGSIPGALVSIIFLQLFDSFYHNQEIILKHALGYILVIVAIITIIKAFYDHKIKSNHWQMRPMEEKRGITIAVGLLFGFIVGLTSIGSGSLFAIFMLYFFRMNPSQIVGTDIAHALVLVTVAGAFHASLGNVDYTLASNLLLGSVPGVLLGSTLSSKAPAKLLRTIVAGIILLSGLKLI